MNPHNSFYSKKVGGFRLPLDLIEGGGSKLTLTVMNVIILGPKVVEEMFRKSDQNPQVLNADLVMLKKWPFYELRNQSCYN